MRKFGFLALALISFALLSLVLSSQGFLESTVPVEHLALNKSHQHSTSKDDGLPPRAPNKWFHAERAFPHGSSPRAEWQQAQLQAKVMRDEARVLESAMAAKGQRSESWTTRGPYNVGGRITSMAVDPTDANTVYAGCAEGGILRSTNGKPLEVLEVGVDHPSLSVTFVQLAPPSRVIWIWPSLVPTQITPSSTGDSLIEKIREPSYVIRLSVATPPELCWWSLRFSVRSGLMSVQL
jgi:hypothetical protein